MTKKGTLWNKEKIAQVIALYKKHECLWNHYKEEYKSKERRIAAIEEICEILRITKFDFGKKIHNLRNQFNSEMKKLERRMEESGCTSGDLSANTRCRWEHFDSLMFLRDVIEPRPAGFQSGGLPPPKKMRLKYDYTSEEDADQNSDNKCKANGKEDAADFNFGDSTGEDETLANQIEAEFRDFSDEPVIDDLRDDIYDQKFNPSTTTAPTIGGTASEISVVNLPAIGVAGLVPNRSTIHSRMPSSTQPKQESVPADDATAQPCLPVSTAPDHPNTTTTRIPCSTQAASMRNLPQRDVQTPIRDQWDAFGELVASEFRNLNSDVSRKKLKRRIMQAMLEVGEEDDCASGT